MKQCIAVGIFAALVLLFNACPKSETNGQTTPETVPEEGNQQRAKNTPRAPGIDKQVASFFTRPFPEGELPMSLKFSPDSSTLAYLRFVGSEEAEDLHIELWVRDVESQRERAIWTDSFPSVGRFEWLPNNQQILVDAGAQLYLVNTTEDRQRRQLTTNGASNAKLAPNGRLVAFTRRHDLYVLDIESGQEQRLTQDGSEVRLNGEIDWVYEEELEIERGFWWSPESTQLAFLQFDETPVTSYPVMYPSGTMPRIVQQRYPQAGESNPIVRLGVVDVVGRNAGQIAWHEYGESEAEIYIARVGWMPSGQSLMVLTLDRLQRNLVVKSIPLSGGEAQILVEEQDEQWLNLLDPPRFLDDGQQFIYRSERDGHAHLYLYSSSGQVVRQLTNGPWEVSEVVDIDEGAQTVHFIANTENHSTYQLYSVPFEGNGEPDRITPESGCHRVVFAPDHQQYVTIHSALNRTPRAEFRRIGSEGSSTIAEEDLRPFPSMESTHGEIFSVPGPDGIEYDARLIRPSKMEAGRRYPVLVWVYNGPGAQLVRDEWRTKYVPWMRMLADRGILVFSMDGRGSYGRGRDWERPIYGRLTEVELEDQMKGIEYLRSLDYVDSDRIGIFGWSYGGTMVLAALLTHPGVFKAGVSVAPVTDWRFYDTIYTERYMMRPQDNQDGYNRTSLWQRAGQLQDPLLLIHGISDENVHFRNTSRMVEALVDHGRHFDLMVYPAQNHGISAPASRRHVFSTITSFMVENLLDH